MTKNWTLRGSAIAALIAGVLFALGVATVRQIDSIAETEALEKKSQRYAMNLSAVWRSASAAGATDEQLAVGDLDRAISNLTEGVDCHSFTECTFKVPRADEPTLNRAKQYLEWEGDVLTYRSEGE